MAANIRTGTLTSPKLIAPPQIGLGMRLLASDGHGSGGVRALPRRSCLHGASLPHGPDGRFRPTGCGNLHSMTNRDLRQLKHALFGPVIGALIAVAAFGLIQVISSDGASIWWWLSAALVGAIGGFTLAS